MDILPLVYYAVICGLLTWISPRLPSMTIRIVVGVVVGLLAAALLPITRSILGM